VRKRPLVITPPQINKYYAWICRPTKAWCASCSTAAFRYFASAGAILQRRIVNGASIPMSPALDEAVNVARDVTGSDDISMMGSCSGGITSTAYFATLGSAGQQKIRNMVLAVCLLDPNTADESAFGCLMTPGDNARGQGNLPAARYGRRPRTGTNVRVDEAERPGLGITGSTTTCSATSRRPSISCTGMPTQPDFQPVCMAITWISISTNPFVNAGKLTLNSKAIDMSRTKVDSYVIAGVTDHITPWKGCAQDRPDHGRGDDLRAFE